MLTVEQLAESYINTLGNKDHAHPAFVIGFAAVPGSGKTTLATKLEQDLGGMRVNKDELNDLWQQLDSEYPTDPQEQLVKTIYYIVASLIRNYPNKLVILDSSLDRKYLETKQRLEQMGIKLFVISIEVPKSELERRINERNKEAAQPYLDKLDGWISDHENFLQNFQPDFLFTDNYAELLERLQREIEV